MHDRWIGVSPDTNFPTGVKHFGMVPSKGHVSIRCIETDAKYRVEFEEAGIAQMVASVEDAVMRAGELVVEETQFTLYSKDGEALVTGTLYPNELSLDSPPCTGKNR